MIVKTRRDGEGVEQSDVNHPDLGSLVVNRIGDDAWAYSLIGHGAHGVGGKKFMEDLVHPSDHVRLLFSCKEVVK